MTESPTPQQMQSLSTIRSSLNQLQNTTDDEVGDMISEIMEQVEDLEDEMQTNPLDDDDRSEIIEHLETIHVESQAIHDFLHSHDKLIGEYGWPRPNPISKATQTEVISEDLIQALEDDPDGTTVSSFVKAVEAQSFTTYQTESGHKLISTSGKHDFDIVVEPDGAYNADEIHDSIEDALADELGLTVRRLKPCNEDSVVHVGVADDHPLFQ